MSTGSPSSDTQRGSTNNSNVTRNLSSLFEQLAVDEEREVAEARAKREEEARQAMRRIAQAMKEARDRQIYNPRKRDKPGLSSNLGQPKFW